MKQAILTPRTLMPARRAASTLPPTAYTCRPKLVRDRRNVEPDEQDQDQRNDVGHAHDRGEIRTTRPLLVEEVGRSAEEDRERDDLEQPDRHRLMGEPCSPAALHTQPRDGGVAHEHDEAEDPPGQGRQVLVLDGQDGLVADGDGAALTDDEQHHALEREEHRERHDERRDAEARDEQADDEADDHAGADTGEQGERQRPLLLRQRDAEHGGSRCPPRTRPTGRSHRGAGRRRGPSRSR